MKKCIKALPVLFVALIFSVLFGALSLFNATPASASSYGNYSFELENYKVTYDIAANCEIKVTEILTIHYTGRRSTGFYRDIPVNAGVQVKDVKVEGVELISGGTDVPYEVIIEDNDFITVDIGDTRNKLDMRETYRLTYLYCINNPFVKSGILPLNPVGTGWECEIIHADVTIILPDGFISATRYFGSKDSDIEDNKFTLTTENGRQVIKTSEDNISPYNGISFDLTFEKGAISPHFNFTPYIFVLVSVLLIFILILVKVLAFSKNRLTPIVNFEAPDNMNPLLMGKLIDNKVNPEDVTALIFYWADKGYIKINLDNKHDPILIRIKNLPETAENYEMLVFAELFKKGDAVKTSSLKYSFYKTFERATAMVNEKTKGLFQSSSVGVSIIFALLGGILLGLAPFILAMTTVSSTLMYYFGFVGLIPALVLYGFTETVAYNRLKNRGEKNVMFFGLLALAVIFCTGLFTLIIPGAIMPTIPKVIFCVMCFSIVALSVIIISRTPEYNKKLNNIVGFRNFILTAEKDRLEKMLESDPQYYYHILPYAQVLNVSNIWEDKFKNLTVAPPNWATGSSTNTFLNFVVLNNIIRNSATGLTQNIVSRPSSSGANGSHGHFGGHSGGGFGGGGGRGR